MQTTSLVFSRVYVLNCTIDRPSPLGAFNSRDMHLRRLQCLYTVNEDKSLSIFINSIQYSGKRRSTSFQLPQLYAMKAGKDQIWYIKNLPIGEQGTLYALWYVGVYRGFVDLRGRVRHRTIHLSPKEEEEPKPRCRTQPCWKNVEWLEKVNQSAPTNCRAPLWVSYWYSKNVQCCTTVKMIFCHLSTLEYRLYPINAFLKRSDTLGLVKFESRTSDELNDLFRILIRGICQEILIS